MGGWPPRHPLPSPLAQCTHGLAARVAIASNYAEAPGSENVPGTNDMTWSYTSEQALGNPQAGITERLLGGWAKKAKKGA